jgi:flagellar basal-body rod protein FlgB
MISPSEDKTFPLVEPLLSWTSRRQQALSSNVANVDTPGYHAQDYSFETELSASLAMNTTSARHITPVQETPSARVFEVGTKEKANGNNVDMDRELTEMAKNGLQYVTLVQYLSQKLRTLRSAISDGGKV